MTNLSLRTIAAAFRRDEQGSISIEFCIVMPLLLFLTTGGLGFWDAFQSNSKTAKVAFTVSDIVSRYDVVGDTEMAYLYGVQDKMLPQDLNHRTLRISSICLDNDGVFRVLWSHTGFSSDAVDPGVLVEEDIPLGILPTMAPQDSVILTEVSADWQPFIKVGIGDQTWRSALVSKPRFVKVIPHTTLNPSNICPSAV